MTALFSFARAYAVTAPLIILSTIFFGAISLAVSFFDAAGHKQIQVARLWSRFLLLAAGVRVQVEGIGNIAKDGSYVFASNHLSYFDTPVVLAHIPVQFRFLAKAGLFKIPFLGTHLASAGHISVPREDPRASVRTLTQAADGIRLRGISMLVFPEGGRTHTGELQPFHEGAAYIAIKSGVPLVPIALTGTRAVLPYGSGHVRPGLVRLQIGEPIPTRDLKPRDRSELSQKLRREIAAMLELSSQKVAP